MPRLWLKTPLEDGTTALDYCRLCWTADDYTEGDPDGFPYHEWPGEYACAECGDTLTEEDAEEDEVGFADEWAAERRQLYGGMY